MAARLLLASLASASSLSAATAWVVASPETQWPPVNPGPLPRVEIVGYGSVSGISSGADFASEVLVAYCDRFFGVGVFAGQAFGCATARFDGEEVYTCDEQPEGQKGPGCVGLNSTGPAPCYGCSPGTTVEYDHCKKNPSVIDLDVLHNYTETLVRAGLIPDPNTPPTLAASRIYTYRGTLDDVYLPGSVNKTGEYFAPYLEMPKEQIRFEASIPSLHALPTVDPNVPRDTCEKNYTISGLQNCGYDGAGRMFQHFYSDSLRHPPPNATAFPSSLVAFDQDMYGNATFQYGGLASFGLAYIPYQCQYDQWVSCHVHVVLHGCGQSAALPSVNTTFALYSGYAQWGDANDIVVLFVQGGGFAERGWTTDAAQVMAGWCVRFAGKGSRGVSRVPFAVVLGIIPHPSLSLPPSTFSPLSISRAATTGMARPARTTPTRTVSF
jgi:hypothetical protein